MQGRSVFLLCALLFSGSLLRAQQGLSTVFTVDDLVRSGIANNKDIAAVRERIAEAEGLVRQAGVRPAPTLGLNGATGKPLGTIGEEQYGGEYSQPVETFRKREKRIRVAEYSVALAKAELQSRTIELAYEIRAAYAQVLAERRKVKLLNDQMEFNQDTLKLTEARVKEGDVAPLEAELLKVEVNQAEVSRMSAQSRLTSAELDLRRLAVLSSTAPIGDSDFSSPKSIQLQELQQKALATRADLKTARLEEEQKDASVELAKADAKPDVVLSAGYSRQYSQFDGLFGVTSSGISTPIRDRVDLLTFGVSIPLRTSRSGAGNVQAETARASGARLQKEYLQRTIPLEVASAYQRWRAASDSLVLLKNGVIDPSSANLSVIRQAYKLGQLRLLDVLNEQRRLIDMQLAYIDAQADAARSWADVERAVGGNLP